MEEKSDDYKIKRMQGSYTFSIDGFGGLSIVGDAVKSPEFTLCGNTWQLVIYFGGVDDKKGFVSFFIANRSSREVKSSYKLMLINQRVGQDKTFVSSGTRLFDTKEKNGSWGKPQFIETEQLINPTAGYCVDDVVIFKVQLTVYDDHQAGVTQPFKSVVPNSLNHSLQNLLSNGTATDVTFSFTNTTDDGQQQQLLHAYKCVLMARSEVFTAMFTTHMSEAHTGLIHMDGSDLTHSVLAEMLHYIYTDTFTSHTALATHSHGLLVAAHKYRVLGLMTTCEDYFISQLTDDNVASTLLLADTHSAVHLRQRCIEYFVQHSAFHIFLTKEWRSLDENLREATIEAINAMNDGGNHEEITRKRKLDETNTVGK